MYVWVFFWALYSVPLICVSVFMSVPQCYNYNNFVMEFEIREHDTSRFVHDLQLVECPDMEELRVGRNCTYGGPAISYMHIFHVWRVSVPTPTLLKGQLKGGDYIFKIQIFIYLKWNTVNEISFLTKEIEKYKFITFSLKWLLAELLVNFARILEKFHCMYWVNLQ